MLCYIMMISSLFLQRAEILNGNIEPTDSDCDWPSDDEDEEDEEENKLAVSIMLNL